MFKIQQLLSSLYHSSSYSTPAMQERKHFHCPLKILHKCWARPHVLFHEVYFHLYVSEVLYHSFPLIKYFVVISSTFDKLIRQICFLSLFLWSRGRVLPSTWQRRMPPPCPQKQECEQLCLNNFFKKSCFFKNKIEHQRIRRVSKSYQKLFVRNSLDTTAFHCSVGIKFQLCLINMAIQAITEY